MWNHHPPLPFMGGGNGTAGFSGAGEPHLIPFFVRPRLSAGLASRTPITIVHGPPGIGKTVVLSHWVEQLQADGTTVLAVDANDTRSTSNEDFWAAVADQAQKHGWLLDPAAASTPEALKLSLEGLAASLVLVVDNVRDVDRYLNSSEIQGLLRSNPRFRTIIGSREPGTPHPGSALIGPDRLLFTDGETRRCLTSRRVSISESSVYKVMSVLRGWPGLVNLAADNLAEDSLEVAIYAAVDQLSNVLRNDPQPVATQAFVRATIPAASLTLALEDQDWATALDIVSQDWIMLSAQHTTLLFQTLYSIPQEVTATHRDADIVRRLLTSQHPTAADELPLPESRHDLLTMMDGGKARAALMRVCTAVNWYRRGARFDELDTLCDRALVVMEEARQRMIPGTDNDLAHCYLHVGACHLLLGDFDRAEREFKFGVEIAGRDDDQMIVAATAGLLAMLYSVQGRIMESAHFLEIEAHQVVSGPLTKTIRTAGKTARLINAVESLDRDAAFQAFEDLDDPAAELEAWPFTVHALCLWHRAFGDPHTVLDNVHRLRSSEWHDAPEGSFPYVMLACAKTGSLLTMSEFELARQSIASVTDPMADNLKIGIQVGTGDYGPALEKPDLCPNTYGPAARVERLLLSFVANDAMRNRGTAAADLRQSLSVSEIAGNFSEYLHVPLHLLKSYVSEVPGLQAVIESIESTGMVYDSHVSDPSTQLSRREIEVIRSLALHPTYATVAEHLFVSTSTIKTHVSTIHRKLGTRERAELMQVAASMGLLD